MTKGCLLQREVVKEIDIHLQKQQIIQPEISLDLGKTRLI